MRIFLVFALAVSSSFAEGDVLSRVAKHAEKIGGVSRQIWENPELGYQETQSSHLLQQELKANGFDVKAGVAGIPTAFTATYGRGKPVIALLGEFDALPGLSQKESAVQEPVVPGAPGHGCGHNLLGAASALAAIAIKEEMEAGAIKGTLRYYGTPAEEGGGGKIYMLHAGLFADVDAVLDWHPGNANRVNLGSSLANNGGHFRFHGQASHAAAAPERGRSALDGAMIMLHAVEMLREHVPQESRIHYIITHGGTMSNVVPALAEVRLIARHPDATVLNAVWDRIMKCAEAGALASETRLEFIQGTNYANIVPNDTLTDVLGRALTRAGGYEYSPAEEEFVAQIQKTLEGGVIGSRPDEVIADKSTPQGMASTDVGDVSWNVPTASFTAASFAPGVRAHTWQAAACAGSSIGRKGMLVAARTLALAAVELFARPEQLAAARADFERRKAGRSWTTRIQPDAKPPLDYLTRAKQP
jgi:aminobenzoyl-glutamate utilization protein B